MSAMTGVWPPRRSNVSLTCAAVSAFASITPARPGAPRSRSMSSDQNRVVLSLIRTQAVAASSQVHTRSRAAPFPRGSTASSRSRITWSASDLAAASKSPWAALTNIHERDSSGVTDRAIVEGMPLVCGRPQKRAPFEFITFTREQSKRVGRPLTVRPTLFNASD